MRSVSTKVLIWSASTLAISLLFFIAVSVSVSVRQFRNSLQFQNISRYQMEEAVRAYQAGGQSGLATALQRLGKAFPEEHHLLDAKGIDLLTGANWSAVLGMEQNHGKLVVVVDDPTGNYKLLMLLRPPVFRFWYVLPYYLPILLALLVLCWLVAVNLGSPLKQLARTVERFGAGDLDARSGLNRRDEIGDLARVFNQMAERLQTLLVAERRLLQDISHELRSPLARLSFATELTKTAKDREAAAQRLRKDIDRLADLVGGLIHVTRAEGEFVERNLSPVSLDELVHEIADACQFEAIARSCSVAFLAVSSVTLRGDPELLRRAIENVVRNAIRYSPPGTTVQVNLERDGSIATVTVRDFGPGVPEEMLPKIFHPFYRVDPSRDAATGGTGLGLAIAQRAVTLHHGQITARNAGPGLLVAIAIPAA